MQSRSAIGATLRRMPASLQHFVSRARAASSRFALSLRGVGCARGSSLLRVLHLLAHLLDQDLHVDRAAGGLEVLGLRGQGIGFAVELLHEEVEPAAGGLARAD